MAAFRLDEPTRRTLSLLVLAAAALLLVAGGVTYALVGAEGRAAYLGMIVALLVLAGAEAYLLFGGQKAAGEARVEEEYLLADEAPVLHEDVYDVKCGRCQTAFQVVDHGVRPLVAACPVCGAEGILEIGRATPVHHMIHLRCPRCQTVNDVEDRGTRPLRARCSQCQALIGLR